MKRRRIDESPVLVKYTVNNCVREVLAAQDDRCTASEEQEYGHNKVKAHGEHPQHPVRGRYLETFVSSSCPLDDCLMRKDNPFACAGRTGTEPDERRVECIVAFCRTCRRSLEDCEAAGTEKFQRQLRATILKPLFRNEKIEVDLLDNRLNLFLRLVRRNRNYDPAD